MWIDGTHLDRTRPRAHPRLRSSGSSCPLLAGAIVFVDRGSPARDLGHVELMLVALLRHLERRRHVEDLLAVLDRDDAARREAGAVTSAIHFVKDRHLWDRRRAGNRHGRNGRRAPRPCGRPQPVPDRAPVRRKRAACGLSGDTPRKMFSSIFSRSSRSRTSSIGRPECAFRSCAPDRVAPAAAQAVQTESQKRQEVCHDDPDPSLNFGRLAYLRRRKEIFSGPHEQTCFLTRPPTSKPATTKRGALERLFTLMFQGFRL